MPCLFLRGVPEGITFRPEVTAELYRKVAEDVGRDIAHVEVHIESTQYQILKPNGTLEPAPDVHIFVEWTGKPFEVKVAVAAAVDEFLREHGLDSDLTFRDSGPGTFFVNGKLIGPIPDGYIMHQGRAINLKPPYSPSGSEDHITGE